MSIEHDIPIVVYIGYDYYGQGRNGAKVKFDEYVKHSGLYSFALDYPSQAYYAMVVGQQGEKFLLK